MGDIDSKDLGKQLEQSNEASSLTAGCSMRPMLRQHKDVVTIKRIDRKLKVGDVVAYKGSGDSVHIVV